MRFLPRTILGRAFLLIGVLIALSVAASVTIFRHAVQEPRVQQMAELVVSAVNLTRAAVLSSAPEWRGALLEELRDAEGMRVQLADAADVIQPMPEHPSELRLMMDEARNRLGGDTRFAARLNGAEGLWVSFRIGGDEFWLSLPREHIDHPLSQVLLAWGSMVFLLALVGAYFIARQVAWPLKRLEHAAHEVGEGHMPPPLPERGAQEIATVSHAFNQMSSDLAASERERALVLAGISHDLRTPLTRVRIAAELTADASLREGLVADVEQMDAVIQQFLDYARLDESEVSVPTDVHALVREVAQSFSAQARSLDLDLQPLPQFSVRPLLLKRALSNLLENAIKYGGGEITVRLHRMDSGVELSVADRGAGIPDELRETAKRPFMRLQTARSDAGGSGLGLAIVERAAHLHGGKFHLEGREGGGLLARLVLPDR
ncbi:two-component sensor histidine kinase [Ferrigenium kumadai]|uniref:histidine kinase n=1 Tax=Ferrigenium kumadai TaxID=1682490 RepID=A0AAN1SZN9_9PROT|nr:ATP-binding protein [Ferrigenium kumadai]BBI99105.1 two-component sensor histidine kinase [Ferrigenium kumadai]